jgi:hypothetical protein
MNRNDALDGLDFDHQPALNQEIHPISAVNEFALVAQWNSQFPLVLDAFVSQLQGQTRRIRRLKKTRAEVTMNFDGAPDDELDKRISDESHGRRNCKAAASRIAAIVDVFNLCVADSATPIAGDAAFFATLVSHEAMKVEGFSFWGRAISPVYVTAALAQCPQQKGLHPSLLHV